MTIEAVALVVVLVTEAEVAASLLIMMRMIGEYNVHLIYKCSVEITIFLSQF